MKDRTLWSLIARYLIEEASPEDKAALLAWADETPANRLLLDEVTKVWQVSGKKLIVPELESEAEWLGLKKAIEESVQDRAFDEAQRIFESIYFRIAAAFILVLAGLFYFLWVSNRPQVLSPALVIYQSQDSVIHFYLPDSSTVWLNTASKLSWAKSFDDRSVTLEGEAFFEVKKGKGSIFSAVAMGTRTVVQGTAFDIKGRPEDDKVEVVVVNGQVSFSENKKGADSIMLDPNDRGQFRRQNPGVRKTKNNDPSFLQWRTVNNPTYELEKSHPLSFLSNSYTWRKNKINQTVIEGEIVNRASLARYTNIGLKITYVTSQGKKREIKLALLSAGVLEPGAKNKYRHTLLDLFSKKSKVNVLIDQAEVKK